MPQRSIARKQRRLAPRQGRPGWRGIGRSGPKIRALKAIAADRERRVAACHAGRFSLPRPPHCLTAIHVGPGNDEHYSLLPRPCRPGRRGDLALQEAARVAFVCRPGRPRRRCKLWRKHGGVAAVADAGCGPNIARSKGGKGARSKTSKGQGARERKNAVGYRTARARARRSRHARVDVSSRLWS